MEQTKAEQRAAKRAAYKAKMVQSSRVAAERAVNRVAQSQAAERHHSYGNAVRDISRDASRRGVVSNKPLIARTPAQVRTANTSSVEYREQHGADFVIRRVLPDTRF